MLPNGASIQWENVGFGGVLGGPQTPGDKPPAHLLAVRNVHLAAESFDVEPHNRPILPERAKKQRPIPDYLTSLPSSHSRLRERVGRGRSAPHSRLTNPLS